MIFIIEDKKYNTETSEEIVEFKRNCPVPTIFGTMGIWRKVILYRTKKSNWFTVTTSDNDKKTAYKEDEESVKKLLKDLNEQELYEKYFGELEEA